MKFSIREAQLFADKNNFVPAISFIFIEKVGDKFLAYTHPYDSLSKNPISNDKLIVGQASTYPEILNEIDEFQKNYGMSAGVMMKNELNQWEYAKSVAAISYRIKIAQTVKEHMEHIGSTSVHVEPSNQNVDEALKILSSKAPDVLKDVADIKTNLNKDIYGEFSSDEPHTLHLNVQKIESEVKNKLSGQSEEQIKHEIINQIALVIAHESGHEHAFNGTKDTSEAPAKQKEKEVQDKIQ